MSDLPLLTSQASQPDGTETQSPIVESVAAGSDLDENYR